MLPDAAAPVDIPLPALAGGERGSAVPSEERRSPDRLSLREARGAERACIE